MPALVGKQELFAVARAEGLSAREAAAKHKIPERTAYRWNTEPATLARIDELQEGVAAEVLRVFRAYGRRAAERITECVEPGRTSATGQLNHAAAKTVLSYVVRPLSPPKDDAPDGNPHNLTLQVIDYADAPDPAL